jgi:hypothetical protein
MEAAASVAEQRNAEAIRSVRSSAPFPYESTFTVNNMLSKERRDAIVLTNCAVQSYLCISGRTTRASVNMEELQSFRWWWKQDEEVTVNKISWTSSTQHRSGLICSVELVT